MATATTLARGRTGFAVVVDGTIPGSVRSTGTCRSNYGTPTLISKRLTGRWILWPGKHAYLPWERWIERRLARYAEQIAVPDGAYYFFAATRIQG